MFKSNTVDHLVNGSWSHLITLIGCGFTGSA
jgi:hypothetical protein